MYSKIISSTSNYSDLFSCSINWVRFIANMCVCPCVRVSRYVYVCIKIMAEVQLVSSDLIFPRLSISFARLNGKSLCTHYMFIVTLLLWIVGLIGAFGATIDPTIRLTVFWLGISAPLWRAICYWGMASPIIRCSYDYCELKTSNY